MGSGGRCRTVFDCMDCSFSREISFVYFLKILLQKCIDDVMLVVQELEETN
jgi:hypothetical protein